MWRTWTSILVLIAALPAWAAPPATADEATRGADIVKQRCLACHDRDKLIAVASRTPAEQRAARWERFLPGHYLPKADERRAVIAWLAATNAP